MIGGFAFLLKQPFVMLYTWLACVALCHFLKDTQRSPFYYAEARETARQIQIAHFDISNEAETTVLLEILGDLNVDLISIQSKGNKLIEGLVSAKLQAKYPFKLATDYEKARMHSTLIFSKIPFETTDTFHCEGLPYLMGDLIIDSSRHRKLQFLSLYLPDNIANDPLLMQEQLSAIGTCWSARQTKAAALMAFGAIPSAAWSPEIRAFRSLCTLHDSRLDLELQANPEHIFYSNHLRCINFESLANGIGVIGTYQLKIPEETVQISAVVHNTALTER